MPSNVTAPTGMVTVSVAERSKPVKALKLLRANRENAPSLVAERSKPVKALKPTTSRPRLLAINQPVAERSKPVKALKPGAGSVGPNVLAFQVAERSKPVKALKPVAALAVGLRLPPG